MSDTRLETLAEDLFVARSIEVEAEGRARGPRLGLADIHAFLTNPSVELTAEQQAALFSDGKVRAAYNRLKRELALYEVPAAIAASSEGSTRRRFVGGSIEVKPSRVGRQVYVMIRLDTPGRSPRALLLESIGRQIVRTILPEPDEDGGIVLIKDLDDDEDGRLIALISDPNTVGALLE